MRTEESCSVSTVWLYKYVAKSDACPHCANLDGEYHARTHHSQPFSIKQHEYCRCEWDVEKVKGTLRADREELMNKHENVKKQWDEAEANIKFCKSYMDDYLAEYEEAMDEKARADELAAYWLNRANENIDAANAILDQFDELTEEMQDWVDELLLLAEEFLGLADEQVQIAADAQRKAWDAKREYNNEEDELDKWIKLKLLAEYELQELEPCLRYPCLEDEIEAIAGSGLHYDLD